jgi:hypothetical protein
MTKKQSVVGIFAYLDEVVAALEELKREQIRVDTVYSPMPRHEIREVLGVSELGGGRFFTLAGGIVGILTGIFLVWYTAAQWRFIVGGKPQIPVIPAVIPSFEFFILISVFFTLAGLLIKNRMPKMRLSAHFDKRFTQDRFGIVVYCADSDREKIAGILKKSGAEEVRQVEE